MAALQISRKVDYALRALIYLAGHPQPQPQPQPQNGERGSTLSDIANQTAVPPHFLAKIIEELAHRGLVRSRRGPRGGYVLARPPAAVSFKDVIEAVEGPIALNTCVGDHDDCVLIPSCGMMAVWQEAQMRLVEVFERATLADVQVRCGREPLPVPQPQDMSDGQPASGKARVHGVSQDAALPLVARARSEEG